MDLPNLKTKKIGGVFRGLFVGDVGTGKTVAAGSFPGPIKIYDFDDRVDPLLNFYPMRDDIEYVTVVSTRSERKDTITFIEFCQEFMGFQDRCPWETVILDSITSLSACCVLYALDLNGEFNLKKGKLPRPQFDEYKGETATVLKILEVCKTLPCHIIATAHPIRKLEPLTPGDLESLRTIYSLTGYGSKTPSFIPVYFNEMYYFYNQIGSQGMKPKRFVSTVGSSDWDQAKTALPLPPVFEVTDKPLYNVLQKFLEEFNVKIEAARERQKAAS
jgi:AAA domain